MIIVSLDRLQKFISSHNRGNEAKADLTSWYWEAKQAIWKSPHEIKARYPASLSAAWSSLIQG